MPPARVRSSLLTLVILLAACGEPAAPASSPTVDAKPTADAQTPAPTPADAKPPVPVPVPTPAVEPAPAPEPTGEDWLVWSSEGGQWITRWIDARVAETTRVAERKALVLSDGTRLWAVERSDGEVDVIDCECFERTEDEAKCTPSARLTTQGLRATELLSGQVLTVRAPGREPIVGNGMDLSIDVEGGMGSRLAYGWTDSGYYCGAHGMNAAGYVVFDLAAGKEIQDPLAAVDRALPDEVRRPAATEILAQLRECDGDDGPTLEEVLGERMGLVSLHVALVDAKPRLTWHFEAETYYACSADYAAHGETSSELLPAAAPLQLDPDALPPGVRRVLTELRQAPTVGWARLSLHGPARQAAIAAFERAPQTPWPPSTSADRPIPSVDGEARRRAKAKLDEGRRLTRAGDHAAAIAAFDAAIELDRALARAWSERGYAKLLAGDLPGAKADLDAALPLDDGPAFRAAVHYNLGQVAEKQGDPTAAKAAYEASLSLRDHESVRKALARVQ